MRPDVGVHRRYDPLLDEWVLVSPHRGRRPWQGQVEPADSMVDMAHDPECHLCPGNARASGERNPDYAGVHVFDNDFPALLPNVAEPLPNSTSPLLRSELVGGVCRVLCYSPRHDLTLAQLGHRFIEPVVDTWIRETRALGDRYRWVQCFENRGAMMGCSSPHPHGQIWAMDTLPTAAAREQAMQLEHARSGGNLLLDVLDAELAEGTRILIENEHWVLLVPWWARWPFETLLLPRTHRASMTDLNAAEAISLAHVMANALAMYDNLFQCDCPFSFGWHGAPLDASDAERDAWQLHAHFYPPLLRSATVRKFMVGFEMLAEAQRDLTPEQGAERLRAALGPHWKA